MQRGGTEDATDGDTSVSRVDVELVPDSGILEVLCINFRASVTSLRQVIKHRPQRHVIGSLALKSCFISGAALHPSAGVPACVPLSSDRSRPSVSISRAQGSQWSHD